MSEPKAVYETPAPLPSYSEWVGMMEARGYFEMWSRRWLNDDEKTMFNQDEAMEFFRRGETPPPIEWDNIPEDAESDHRRIIENALADINAARLLVAEAVEDEGEHKLWNLLYFAETKLNSILDEVAP